VSCPEAFDEHGFPIQEDGAITVIPGLYFVGVHFLRKRKSSLIGVGDNARPSPASYSSESSRRAAERGARSTAAAR
jgi:putative flavoprotein involved in K+ transport